METCSYLYSLENHFSHVSTYILQLWPDTSSMYPAMPDTCFLYISFSFCRIHALCILPCRIPLFHSSSTQYFAYPALTENLAFVPLSSRCGLYDPSHSSAFRHGRIHAFGILPLRIPLFSSCLQP